MTIREAASAQSRVQIFRARDAQSLDEAGNMRVASFPSETAEGVFRTIDAGVGNGSETKLLFAVPGMSLVYAWFKPNFPLPRHSHNADCLYYVLAGEMKFGTESLSPGDGVLVPSNTPYTFSTGDDGVEFLEFRTKDQFDIKILAKNKAYWDKAVKQIVANKDVWEAAIRPSQIGAQIDAS